MREMLAGMLVVVIAVALSGCAGGGGSEAAAEREIVARAPEIVGAAEAYRAEVKGIAAQRVDSVTLIGVGVKPSPELLLETLTVTLRGIEYQARPFRITKVAQGTFSTRVSEAAVNHYLQHQALPTPGTPRLVRVQFQQGKVSAVTAVKAMGMDFSLSTTGRIEAKDGLHVHYVPERLEVLDIPVPAAVRGLIVNRAFPLVDLTGLRFAPRITRLTLEPGGIRITGTARLREVDEAATKP